MPSHETAAIGCTVEALLETGPFSLTVARDNNPPAHLAHLAGTGIGPSKMVWTTRFTRRGNNTLPELGPNTVGPPVIRGAFAVR